MCWVLWLFPLLFLTIHFIKCAHTTHSQGTWNLLFISIWRLLFVGGEILLGASFVSRILFDGCFFCSFINSPSISSTSSFDPTEITQAEQVLSPCRHLPPSLCQLQAPLSLLGALLTQSSPLSTSQGSDLNVNAQGCFLSGYYIHVRAVKCDACLGRY